MSQLTTGIIVVDHGSRRSESNDLLLEAAQRFAKRGPFDIVEPAHMELAAPDIAEAFRRCVERGAEFIVVFPWFLSPGRHWKHDIPDLVRQAAEAHPTVNWKVTPPFGLHDGMMDIVEQRIQDVLTDM